MNGFLLSMVCEPYGPRDGCLFHIRSGPHSKCRKRIGRGDKRELIHIDEWRVMDPLAMIATPYLQALGARLG